MKKILIAHIENIEEMFNFYQKYPTSFTDPTLSSEIALKESLENSNTLWIIEKNQNDICTMLSIIHDPRERLSKINRFYQKEQLENHQLISFILEQTSKSFPLTDIIYITTPFISPCILNELSDLGFKALGMYPHPMGELQVSLFLSAFFYPQTLKEKRFDNFSIHPQIENIYQIANQECGLSPINIQKEMPPYDTGQNKSIPELELIDAPLFVAFQHRKLSLRRFLTVNFYPYQAPNALICDPELKFMFFLKIIPNLNYATIIGEFINQNVSITELYNKLFAVLNRKGIYHLESINDAGDFLGTDCILKAGFRPCAYFPCMKYHSGRRRDYVIYAKSNSTDHIKNVPELTTNHINFLNI